MKRIAVAALTLAIALPLAAQESPPPEATEAEAEPATAEATAAEAAAVEAEAEAAEAVEAAETAEAQADAAVDAAAQTETTAEAEAVVDAEVAAEAEAASQAEPAAPPAEGRMSTEMQAMMEAWQKASTPGPQHAQLAEHFVGNWNAQTTVWMDPSAPPMTSTGSEVTSAEFGGRHLISEFNGSMMGQPFTGRAVTSYDNTTGRYLVSWLDSMSTNHYFADGEYDAASKTYTFNGEMPDPMQPGTSIPIRQVIRIDDADHHVMEWYETRDGQELKTMEIKYTRADAAAAGG